MSATVQPASSRERTSSGMRSNSSSSSTPASSAVNTPSPISVDGLLTKYASSSNPPISALQQAVSDYNTLTSQNTQLWKLIEKQRNGYNQIMKELERVRGERDTYKARLHTISAQSVDPPPRKHRTSDADRTQPKVDPRAHLTRHYSDEQHTPTQHIQTQNGDIPPRTSSKAHPPPLTVPLPPPTDSLPVLASGISATQETAPFSHLHSSSNTSLPSVITTSESSRRPSLVDEGNPSIVFTEHRSRSQSNASSLPESAPPLQSAPVVYEESSPSKVQGPPPHSAQPPPNSALLTAGQRAVSRDSHVSLPDEAKRYISNMVDSPVPSPKMNEDFARSETQLQSATEPDKSGQFLDLNTDDDDSEDDEQTPSSQNHTTVKEPTPSMAPTPPSQPTPATATPERPRQKSEEPRFRSLPLLPHDLPYTQIHVSSASVRPNDKGKDVLSFSVYVRPGPNKDPWRVDKLYSDIIALDQRVRASVSKSVVKKIGMLPEPKLWKDHAPVKVDQRKAALEAYLESLIKLPVKDKNEIIAFLTSDIIRETQKPVVKAGYKEGYLTKRGKNFGGWKSRYFVLAGPELEYYESRGGTHLGTIQITGAQIGRQQRNTDRPTPGDDEKEYRHAFLIVEAKKGPGGNHPRHVLCAESDADRDSWVEMLVRYFTGTYTEDTVPLTWPTEAPPRPSTNTPPQQSYSSDTVSSSTSRRPGRGMSTDDIQVTKGTAVPIAQLAPDPTNAKLFQSAPYDRAPSPTKESSPTGVPFGNAQAARRIMEGAQPSSLPDPSPLASYSSLHASNEDENPSPISMRPNSEQGHYPDLETNGKTERKSRKDGPSSASSHQDRGASPEKADKVKISGPLNGAPIPAGYKFGREPQPEPSPSSDRREKAKSRSFWGFGRPTDKAPPQPSSSTVTASRGPVFGVPLEDALDVSKIANLPAIVFRCIQYLEAQKAEQEEGIYRLNGSSALIKTLKDKFNAEGDFDLQAPADEYWDPHAVAGLLKGFLRDLPSSILTRDLHMKFLSVMDFADPQERVRELSNLIASLPLANYSLLRALTAHLILIVQNSTVNKMTVRNIGIVFSPTLGIPAGVFSLMLGEFNRVFNVDNEGSSSVEEADIQRPKESKRRNSHQYTDAAADQMLGLSGRSLAPADESDADDISISNVSASDDGDVTVESASTGGPAEATETPTVQKASKASAAAASKGLNVAVSERGNRHSRIMGLPASPRPPGSPSVRTPTQ